MGNIEGGPYIPSAAMRYPGDSPADWARREQRRDVTYYLWVALPAKLGLLLAVIYMTVTGNTSQTGWFLYHIWFPLSFAAVVIVTPFIYGLWRSVKVFLALGVIIAIAVLLLS